MNLLEDDEDKIIVRPKRRALSNFDGLDPKDRLISDFAEPKRNKN